MRRLVDVLMGMIDAIIITALLAMAYVMGMCIYDITLPAEGQPKTCRASNFVCNGVQNALDNSATGERESQIGRRTKRSDKA